MYHTEAVLTALPAVLPDGNMSHEAQNYASIEQDLMDEGYLNGIHPLAFAARANSADTPNYYEAMNGPDSYEFMKAMDAEVDALENLDAWDIVPREEATNIIDSTWAFKRKRFPDGSVRKYKARLCVRGDQQVQGVDYFKTYSPVVSWLMTQLLLVLSVHLGLKSKQVDYSNAFIQADLEEDVFIEMPRGYRQDGKVLRLKKSVYGLSQAPLTWFNKLKGGLLERGFRPSTLDPCLFISDNVICLVYVDDCLFFARDEKDIDKVIGELRCDDGTYESGRFDLNIEDDVAGFLGILMEKTESGIEMKQTGLIDRIIKATGLENANSVSTPALTKPVGADEDGPPCEESWSYSSVIGMLLYLAQNSRADIAFAVHSCARYSHKPKRSHEQAVKRIVRYLIGTRTRGMMIQPTEDLALDCYVDADYAGLWGVEDDQDPTCVKSRTGFVITLGGAPVLWISKLQTEICLSTLESEYVALSHAMRELLPMRLLVEELSDSLGVDREELTTMSTVWEDNNGALSLAKKELPRMTPRTKHLGVKYHWFRSHVGVERGIDVRKIDTKEQKGDIFTKGLPELEFVSKRAMIMGW
jgi:hypothetical protein